ncbi:MAG: Rpn family recombination-promoting nuclease/putative transposase [Lachnospiraceae bacterium]|nr:Rpn family recombination-promoting nuclease/putative transposase [Lachnospiraceae bacterium]
MKENKYLLPKVDLIFRLLFGDERNCDILKAFLLSVLRLPEKEYEEIKIVDPHLLPEYDGDKLGILDVKVKTKTGKVIDIEIQVNPSDVMRERVVFYISKMVTEQISSGDGYEEIKKAVSILIADYDLIENSPRYHHRFTLYDIDSKVEFTDLIEINSLELGKLPPAPDGTMLWNWLKFLSSEKEEDFEMVADKNPQIKNAVARLAEISSDEQTRRLYESRHKMEWDIRGREKKAIKDAKIEIAKKMLKRDRPIEEIIEDTGLALEEIEKLQKAGLIANVN